MRRPGTAMPDGAPRYKTASAHAVAVLKKWINDGVLAPGSTIDQVQISEDLGMSRVPIRTALERLASEGLVVLAPHRRAIVVPLSLQEMRDLYYVRHHLEGVAAELAARHRTDEDLAALGQILASTEAQIGRAHV